MQALRHTYLRVLHPLLANSQLGREGMSYKAPEIRQVLRVLSGEGGNHFAPADPTTVRLVTRCRTVPWLKEDEDSPWIEDNDATSITALDKKENGDSASPNGNHRRIDSKRSDGDGAKEVARRTLGMNLQDGGSALSVAAVAEHTEKPGVLTPSRANDGEVA